MSNPRTPLESELQHIREYLTYDPDTGIIKWAKCSKHASVAGKNAGSINRQGYSVLMINRRTYLAHRVAWFLHIGSWPDMFMDHKNGDRADNRFDNLRNVTYQQNRWNTGKTVGRSSDFVGAVWHKAANKWQSQIKINGVNKHLGLFDSQDAAHAAYCDAADAAHGEFRRTQ